MIFKKNKLGFLFSLACFSLVRTSLEAACDPVIVNSESRFNQAIENFNTAYCSPINISSSFSLGSNATAFTGVGTVELTPTANNFTITGGGNSIFQTATAGNIIIVGSTLEIAGGTASISAGALQFNDSENFGLTSISVLNNGTIIFNASGTITSAFPLTTLANLQVNSGNSVTASGVLSGTSNLTISGGTLTLSGTNTYTGLTTLSSGVLLIANSTALGTGSLAMSPGTTLVLNATTNISNTIAFSGSNSIGVASGTATLQGIISGTGSLVSVGSGTLVLAAANSYTGGSTLASTGQLVLANATALGSGALTLNGGSTLNLLGGITVANAIALSGSDNVGVLSGTATLQGTISGLGSLTVFGPGTLVLSGSNSYSGGTSLTQSAGQLVVANATALGSGALTLNTGSTLNLIGGITVANAVALSGSDNVGVLSGTATLQGTISGLGSLTVFGPGTLVLSASNSYSGGTSLTQSAGQLVVANATALGSGALSLNTGSTLNLVGGITVANAVALSGSDNVGVLSGTATLQGTISGSGSLTVFGPGTLVLSGSNSYSGGTSLTQSAGQLVLANSTGLGIGALTLNTGSTLNLVGGINVANAVALSGSDNVGVLSGTATLQGTISGSGSLTVFGPGTLVLSGSNSYSGGTSLTQGVAQLELANSTALGSGALTMNAGSSLTLINGISVSNSIVLSGSDNIGVISGGALLSGVISGTGSLIATGPGILTLSGVDTYTGTTYIGTGTLALINSGSISDSLSVTVSSNGAFNIAGITAATQINTLIGEGPVVMGSKSLTIQELADSTYSGVVSGAGTLTISGSATLTLTGDNVYTGRTNISSGTVSLLNTGSISDSAAVNIGSTATLTIKDATVDVTINTLSGSGFIIIGDTDLLVNQGQNQTYAGIISNSSSTDIGGFTKQGVNTLTLTGVNTLIGPITIDTGELALSGSGSIANAVSVNINSNSVFSTDHTTSINELISSVSTSSVVISSGVLTINQNAADTTFDGVISGSGGISVAGTNILKLTGDNTYSGTTTISGFLTLDGTGSIADSAAVVFTGGTLNLATTTAANTIQTVSGTSGSINMGTTTLTIAQNSSGTFGGVISAVGPLVKSGTATLTLTGTNTYTGITFVNAGTLSLSGSGSIATSSAVNIAASGTVNIGGTTSTTLKNITGSGSLALGSATLIVNEGVSSTFAGIIAGSGNVVKSGTATLTLSGINSYTGNTVVELGTLALSGSGSIAQSSSVAIDTGAILNVGGTSSTTINNLTGAGSLALGAATLTINETTSTSFSGIISGTGFIIKTGGATFTLSGSNTYSGGTRLSEGYLSLSSSNALGTGTLSLNTGTTFLLNSGISVSNNITLSGSDNIGVLSDSATLSGIISGSGSLVAVGPGILILTGSNSYTGSTSITGGSVSLSESGSISSSTAVIMSGATTLDISGTTSGATIQTLSGSGFITLGSQPLTINQGSTGTYSGVISGTGSLIKSGSATLTLSGSNTYTGSTTITAGTLVLSGTISPSSSVAISSGAALNINTTATIQTLSGAGSLDLGSFPLTITQNLDATFSGVISGTGSMTKSGSATLTLSGTNTFSGGTTLSQGTLSLANSTALGSGTLSFNTGTTLALSGGLTVVNPIVLSGSDSIVLTSGTSTLSGAISGTGTLAIAGSGTLVFSGTDTYTSATEIQSGVLVLSGSGSLATSSSVNIFNGASLIVSGVTGSSASINTLLGAGDITIGAKKLIVTQNASQGFSGDIIGTGEFEKAGSATLSFSGEMSYTGITSITGGTLGLSGIGSIQNSTALNVGSGAFFDIADVSSETTIHSLTGSGTVLLGSNTLVIEQDDDTTFSGQIEGSGGITKTGSHELTLSGSNNTYSGTTNIEEGSIIAGANDAFSPNSVVELTSGSGVILALANHSVSIKALSGTGPNGTVALGSGTLQLNFDTGTYTYGGLVTGSGSIIIDGSGTQIFTRQNAYSGGTFVAGGTFALSGSGSIPQSPVNISSGAVLDVSNATAARIGGLSGSGNVQLGSQSLTVIQNSSSTFEGLINGSGNLIKAGNEPLILSKENPYTGTTRITAGTLKILNRDAISASSSIILTAGSLDLTFEGANINTLSGIGGSILLGDQILTVNQLQTGSYAGSIVGSGGSVVVNATSPLKLGGISTYTGPTLLEAGSLYITHNGSIARSSSLLLASGTTLDISETTTGTTISSPLGSGSIILGSKNLNIDSGDSSTYSGVISGSGNVEKGGTGVLTLEGANLFTGDFSLLEGEVDISQNTALGVGGSVNMADTTTLGIGSGLTLSYPFVLAAGSEFIQVSTGIATLTGPISGDGGVKKIGAGALVLTAAETYTGDTSLEEGILVIKDSLTSNVTTSPDTILRGTAIITGNVVASGAIAPGSSPGIMTVVGDVTLEPGSSLIIALGNEEQSELQVLGNLTIGSDVTAFFATEPQYVQVDQLITFATADMITGRFERALTNSVLLDVELFYKEKSIDAEFTFVDLAQLFPPSNALNVWEALVGAVDEGNSSLNSIFGTLYPLSLQEIGNALNQMQPSLYKGLAISQENNAVKVQDTIGYRLQQQLSEAYCFAKNPDPVKENNPPCGKTEKRFHLWVDGFGDFLHQKSNKTGNSPQVGYQNNTGGIVVGIDGNFAHSFYAGALGGYTGSSISWIDDQGSGDIDTGYAGVYLSGEYGLFYASASALGGWSHYSADRSIVYSGVHETASNTHGGSQLLLNATAGFNFNYQNFSIRPFDSFEYITQSEQGFTESGAGVYNLVVQKTNAIMVRNELGLQLARCACFPSSRWTFSPKFSWVRECRIKGRGYSSRFATATNYFTTTGYFPNRNLYSPGFLVTGTLLNDLLSFDLYYNGEYGKQYSDSTVGAEIRFGF